MMKHPRFIALVVLSFLWILFFWRLLTPEKADRLIFTQGDFTVQSYPFSDYFAQRLHDAQLPLWNPYSYAGTPFAADPQSGVWYPIRWIAVLLVGKNWDIESLQWEVAAHFWIASLLTYAFLRHLTQQPTAAFVGSILFTYGSYLTSYPVLQVQVLESGIWLPLALLGVHLSIHRKGWEIHGISLAGLAIGLSFLASHPQTTLYLLYLTIAYLVFLGIQQKLLWQGLSWRVVLTLMIGIGLGAIQLLPALEFTRLSFRIDQYHYTDKGHGFAISEIGQLIWPQSFGEWSPLYIGIAGLFLAIGSIWRGRSLFWLAVAVVGLFISFGQNTVVYDFFYVFVPSAGLFRQQERYAFLVSFALVVLATLQLDDLLSRRELHSACRWLVRGQLMVYVAILLLVEVSQNVKAEARETLFFVTLISLLFVGWYEWQQDYNGQIWHVATVLTLIIVIDLFTFGTRSSNYVPDIPQNRVTSPVLLDTLQVSTPEDIAWRVDGAGGVQAYGLYFRIPDIYGVGAVFLKSIKELREIPVDRFWEVLAVRYLTMTDEPPLDRVSLELLAYGTNYAGQEYKVFELQNPRPFAYLVYDYRVGDNPIFTRQIMADPRVNLREMAVTHEALPFELDGTRPEMSEVADFRWQSPEVLEMTISTSENALLTLSIPNYPGWEASIGGKTVKIIDTYAGLIGIPISSGENQKVKLQFRPRTVLWGGVISGVTLSLMGLYVVLVNSRVR